MGLKLDAVKEAFFYARGKYVTLADGGRCNFLKTCLKINAKKMARSHLAERLLIN